MNASEGKMVIFKAALYFVAVLLTPFAGLLNTAADANTNAWPTSLQIASAMITGLVSSCIALRAYFDGSNARYEGNKAAQPQRQPPPAGPVSGT